MPINDEVRQEIFPLSKSHWLISPINSEELSQIESVLEEKPAQEVVGKSLWDVLGEENDFRLLTTAFLSKMVGLTLNDKYLYDNILMPFLFGMGTRGILDAVSRVKQPKTVSEKERSEWNLGVGQKLGIMNQWATTILMALTDETNEKHALAERIIGFSENKFGHSALNPFSAVPVSPEFSETGYSVNFFRQLLALHQKTGKTLYKNLYDVATLPAVLGLSRNILSVKQLSKIMEGVSAPERVLDLWTNLGDKSEEIKFLERTTIVNQNRLRKAGMKNWIFQEVRLQLISNNNLIVFNGLNDKLKKHFIWAVDLESQELVATLVDQDVFPENYAIQLMSASERIIAYLLPKEVEKANSTESVFKPLEPVPSSKPKGPIMTPPGPKKRKAIEAKIEAEKRKKKR